MWNVGLYVMCIIGVATSASMSGSQNRSEPPSTTEFFHELRDNLTRVTWAHAVNDAQYLKDVLNSDVMMIEADIVFGTLDGDDSGKEIPVMGHPPVNHSDLSLQTFLNQINEHNNKDGVIRKGVKLDFKSIEVFEDSISMLETLYSEITFPFWLNADILSGPVDSSVTPVNAKRFLAAASKFPRAELSTGWTTQWSSEGAEGSTTGSYESHQIEAMVTALAGVTNTVTFPVRAGIAANSREALGSLVSATANLKSTLTVWSSEGDFVDTVRLRDLILETGLDRVYLDVPADLADKLNL